MNSSFLTNAKSALLESFSPISADFAGWEKQEWQQLQADPGVRVASEATHFGHWTSPPVLVITVVLNLACLLESPGELCKSPDAQTLSQIYYIRAS